GKGPGKLDTLWEIVVEPPSASPIYSDWRSDASLGDPVTPPVIAGGSVYVSVPDRHQVRAFEARTGQARWSFTAGARVDNPPTLWKGWCVFGSRDGYVYCLNADTGALAWRFEAAPLDRRIVAFGQVESAWPVPGSVLVDESGTAFFSAGRSIRSDGGIFLYSVDVATGALKWKTNIPGNLTVNSEKLGRGYTPLVDAGEAISAGTWGVSKKDGSFIKSMGASALAGSQMGISDGSWRRLNSPLRKSQHAWFLGGRQARGIVMAFSEASLCGYRETKYTGGRGDIRIVKSELFCSPLGPGGAVAKEGGWKMPIEAPAQFESAAIGGDAFFTAGPLDGWTPKEAVLWRVSVADGKKLAELKLPCPPVFDGLAVAHGRLFVSFQDGRLACLGDAAEKGE
ncbi:MAG TPA: PQQ-binding-like beta-propeller repeat protein, partial [Planctomycetota bacterium]|nr:PQQ-binding-like beta-propeller repeat protein [Planctomycetota bacterium]